MSAEIYVGKDVTVTLQIPCDHEVLGVGDAANRDFSFNHSGLSDRNLDGVVDESDVDVFLDGVQVAIADYTAYTDHVNLDTAPGLGVAVSADYRYNGTPYLAQTVTINPLADVEGIDALGSDTIQVWARTLRHFRGTIREVFQSDDQLIRLGNFSVILDKFPDAAGTPSTKRWTIVSGTWAVNASHQLRGQTLAGWIRNALAQPGNLHARFRLFLTTFAVSKAFGFIARAASNLATFVELGVQRTGGGVYQLFIRDEGAELLTTNLVGFSAAVWHDIDIWVRGDSLTIKHNMDEVCHTHENPANDTGYVGFRMNDAAEDILIDDVLVEEEWPLGKYGMLIEWDDGTGHVITVGYRDMKMGLSVASPKSGVVYVESTFEAKYGKVMY